MSKSLYIPSVDSVPDQFLISSTKMPFWLATTRSISPRDTSFELVCGSDIN